MRNLTRPFAVIAMLVVAAACAPPKPKVPLNNGLHACSLKDG